MSGTWVTWWVWTFILDRDEGRHPPTADIPHKIQKDVRHFLSQMSVMVLERYKWMTLREAKSLEREAERLGVSEVARSPRGFMRAYEAVRGSRHKLSQRLVPGISHVQTWDKRRDEFVARHLKQYREKPTYRRWLALAMWAYRAPTSFVTDT